MRNVTAATTDEQIVAPIADAKTALAEYATEQVTGEFQVGERLVGLAQAVRNAEELASAQLHYRDILVNKPENAPFYLIDLLSRTDDSWSGRGNDSRRSASDVIRRWASDEGMNLRLAQS